MITGINESKGLTKHISCECKCKFDGRNWDSNPKGNNDKCRCVFKNLKECDVCKKDDIRNPAKCTCENGRSLKIVIDNSVVTCNKIIDVTKVVPTETITTKRTSTNFYILIIFVLITIALMTAVSISCYPIPDTKYFLSYHLTSTKLKEIDISIII